MTRQIYTLRLVSGVHFKKGFADRGDVSAAGSEPASGIDDVHMHPALPRPFRLALQLTL